MDPVERIDPEAARAAMTDDQALLVVAYEEEERAREYQLEGAITLAELEERRDELSTDQVIIFYCHCPADEAAIRAAEAWQGEGFGQAKVLAGGYDAWRSGETTKKRKSSRTTKPKTEKIEKAEKTTRRGKASARLRSATKKSKAPSKSSAAEGAPAEEDEQEHLLPVSEEELGTGVVEHAGTDHAAEHLEQDAGEAGDEADSPEEAPVSEGEPTYARAEPAENPGGDVPGTEEAAGFVDAWPGSGTAGEDIAMEHAEGAHMQGSVDQATGGPEDVRMAGDFEGAGADATGVAPGTDHEQARAGVPLAEKDRVVAPAPTAAASESTSEPEPAVSDRAAPVSRLSPTQTARLARDVMTRNPDSINVNASVCVAACKMREAGVGALPVRDDGGKFIGMITDRDITIRVTAEGKNPDTTTVGDAMTRDFVACHEEASIREVGRVMQQHQIRRIPIVKKGEQDPAHPSEIVGIISLGDLATDLQASDVPAETLTAVSEPSTRS